ncbi:CBO0543 family protein [Aquibacillus kalidii]|uniref:CBO0543 family protein n=1 Tax=Aquibacillus kalidii TaxID=2762597 RepID=UPI00164842D4|nr:CBO0543 family protein [Aquibacillus kalidii]
MKIFTPFNTGALHISWGEVVGLRREIRDLQIDYWFSETVFTFNWWLLAISSIVVFVVWIIVLDKKRIIEIAAFGLLVGTTTFILDSIGVALVLWSYPDRVIPILPPIAEIHKIHLPITYMIIYQYFSTWRSYLVSVVIASFTFSFILEPLTVWLDIYKIYHWEYIYSFPLYILIGFILRAIMLKARKMERN